MDTKRVLVVDSGADEEHLRRPFEQLDCSVDRLSDLTTVFDELTRSETHCLVLPSTVDDQSGVDVAAGIRELFPDLPIVLLGGDLEEVPSDLDAVAVNAKRLDDRSVLDTVRGCLSGPEPAVAGRPPSPMETLLLSMFEQFPVHLYAKDDEARHVMLSDNELAPTDLMGQTDLDFTELPEEHREAAYRDEMRVIENDAPRLEVEEFTDYIDSHSLTSKVPWHDADGEVRGLVGLTQDITEYKRQEQASRRQHERLAKVALVATHEFRNELQIAHGRLQLSDATDEQIAVVEESLSRMASIVDTVVELASEGQTATQRKPLWLSTLSREVWDTLASSQATLRIEEDNRIVADPEAASLFLQILFKNALEHAGPSVTVTVGTTEDGFYVADDGPGFEVEPPERVLDAGFSTVEGNTGFGLYVARRLANDHEWTLSLSEGENGGACFDVGDVGHAE
jgi:signal transduction histidine kinase